MAWYRWQDGDFGAARAKLVQIVQPGKVPGWFTDLGGGWPVAAD